MNTSTTAPEQFDPKTLLSSDGYRQRLIYHWRDKTQREAWELVELELFEAFGLRRFRDYRTLRNSLSVSHKNQPSKVIFWQVPA